MTLPPTSDYDGATVNFSGSGLNALCTAFQLEGNDIFGKIITYSNSQANGTIMNYPVKADGTLQKMGKTTNGDFGHWFNANGTAISYGNGCVVYAEFTKATKSAVVGQFPNANTDGTKRTVREALCYKDRDGRMATAYLVFNVTFQANASPRCHLAAIDYTAPESTTISAVTIPTKQDCHAYDLLGRQLVNGKSVNGQSVNGKSVNGKSVNGQFVIVAGKKFMWK